MRAWRVSGPRRLSRSRRGEIAVFDVVLFMPLMIVALLFLQSALAVQASIVPEMTNGSRYADEGLHTLLTATVPLTRTADQTGGNTTFQDYSVRQLILWDVYLVSCQTTAQSTLDRSGWVGWSINATAASVAEGTVQSGAPTSFTHYYLAFNGTAPAGPYCSHPPVPVHVHLGGTPAVGLTNVYTSMNVLLRPSLPGEGGVQVVLGVWQQA